MNDHKLANHVKHAKTAGEAAGLWWANELRVTKPAIVQAFSFFWGSVYIPDESALHKFTKALEENVDDLLRGKKAHMSPDIITICCPRRPDELLTMAASKAQFPPQGVLWPLGIVMLVGHTEVAVRRGYNPLLHIVWSRP